MKLLPYFKQRGFVFQYKLIAVHQRYEAAAISLRKGLFKCTLMIILVDALQTFKWKSSDSFKRILFYILFSFSFFCLVRSLDRNQKMGIILNTLCTLAHTKTTWVMSCHTLKYVVLKFWPLKFQWLSKTSTFSTISCYRDIA